MRMPPLPADSIHARACKLKCEKILTRPFKQELVAYLDYYNNRRIKAKLKGLPPAIHRQQALSAA